MLKMFTRIELLGLGQTVLVMFEHRMNDISSQTGALETLSVYRDLVLLLRKWMQSEEGCCMAFCVLTFLYGLEARIETINKQLAKINDSTRSYKELQFPYFGKSVCFSYCPHFSRDDVSMVTTCMFVMLTVTVLNWIVGRRFLVRRVQCLLITVFCFCFAFFDIYIAASACTVICVAVGLKRSGLLKLMKNEHAHYAAFTVFAIEKKMFVTLIIFWGVGITSKLFRIRSFARLNDVLHVSTIMYLVHSYVCEFEVLHYLNTYMLSFIHPLWILVSSLLVCPIVLRSIFWFSKLQSVVLYDVVLVHSRSLYLGWLAGILIVSVLTNSFSEPVTLLFQVIKFNFFLFCFALFLLFHFIFDVC